MKKLLLSSLLCSSAMANHIGEFHATVGYMPDDTRTYGSLAFNGIFASNHIANHKVGIEYIYFEREIDEFLGVDLESPILAINYEAEFKTKSNMNFYVGGGVGIQFHNLESGSGTLSDDETGFAQLQGGVRFHLSPHSTVNIGVRRLFFDDFTLLEVPNLDPGHQWAFEAGFSFRF